MKRCAWPRTPAAIEYHDREWGVPVHDDRVLFEFIVLEGAQAGLSWETILAKRGAYRRAFAGFDPARVARFSRARRARLMRDPGIVRNRLKIESAVTNAAAVLEVQREFGSFDSFLWGFVERGPRRGKALSVALSRELKRRGFRFVGPTICYAFMQAVGIVNDHTAGCFRRHAVSRSR